MTIGKISPTAVPEYVAIATTTRYDPDTEIGRLRARLASDTVRDAIGFGYDVTVVDGSRYDDFKSLIERCGARLYDDTGETMGAGRRQVLRLAEESGRDVVAWMEPEKADYVNSLAATALPILEGSASIVVPKRRSMESYPRAQALFEQAGNAAFKDLTGRGLDMWSGPRTMSRRGLSFFLNYDGRELGYPDLWDSIFNPVLDALFVGENVLGVPVDYRHPPEQTRWEEEHASEMNLKRLAQLENLVTAMTRHWQKLHSEG